MATTTWTAQPRNSLGRRLGLMAAGLVVILILGALALALNYWLGLIFLFISLPLLVGFGFRQHEARNLWLLLLFSLFVALLVGSLAQLILSSPGVRDLAAGGGLLATMTASGTSIFVTSVLLGLGAAFLGVIVPFLLIVAVAAAGILKWHKRDGDIFFGDAYRYLLATVLGMFYPSVVVDNGEFKGKKRDRERLEDFGGPAWLTVYPGQVVVLHRRGGVTRVIGQGSTMLERGEKIRAVVPLTVKGNVNTLENVLTRDRVPLTLKVVHAVQVEPAAETRQRLEAELNRLRAENAPRDQVEAVRQQLQALESDQIVGDDYDQCYARTARLVAAKAPNIWEAMKWPVASTLKDIVMTCSFEDLFNVNGESDEPEGNINNRKLAEIEKVVFERAKKAAPGRGLVLRGVDINEIQFPPEIRGKINEEVNALADARIKQVQAQTHEVTSRFEAQARRLDAEVEESIARFKAGARLQLAEAEARAEQLRASARAEYFKQVIRVLKEQGQSDETIQAVLKSLASSAPLEAQLRQLLQPVLPQLYAAEQPGRALPSGAEEEG